MPDDLPSPSATDLDAALKRLGERAHQLRAATHAADHFGAGDAAADRDTGCWLMSVAVDLASALAAELDAIARLGADRPADAAALQRVATLRVRAHQLHAAARAADRFLEQDGFDARDTGVWLVATARDLARRLAGEIDDGIAPVSRRAPAAAAEPTWPRVAVG